MFNSSIRGSKQRRYFAVMFIATIALMSLGCGGGSNTAADPAQTSVFPPSAQSTNTGASTTPTTGASTSTGSNGTQSPAPSATPGTVQGPNGTQLTYSVPPGGFLPGTNGGASLPYCSPTITEGCRQAP